MESLDNIKKSDIRNVIIDFKKDLSPTHRFSSFDYCYNYFMTVKGDDLLIDIEKSCLTLGFYLASWGMFRNSFLLDKSVLHYEETIKYIASLDQNAWKIDVHNYYENDNIKTIIDINKELKRCLVEKNKADLTLVTKVQLGVFGFIPAYDQYFCNTFREIFSEKCGFRRVNENSLKCLTDFYSSNKLVIDELANNTFTIDFKTKKETTINYPKAKIIDMYGFMKRI
jgi:hypothetical protein